MHIGKKGFTLVEIIVSLAIMSIVAGAVGAFVIAGNNSYMRGNKELTLQEEAQLTANQLIDLIIDVERGISFEPNKTVDAVNVEGSVVANDVPGAELILRNNDNVYMVRWQGGSGYDSANQLYLYEAANSGKDADGNMIWGDPETAAPSLMAEYVTAFNVDLTDLDKRKVKLEMTFTYQDKTYNISETIQLRNDLSGEESTDYAWITGLTIDPTSAELNRGAVQKFNYYLTGDEAAVAKGVAWKVTKADGSSCNSSIDSTGKLTIASDEEIGDGVLIVTCTAVADPTKVASAVVSVKKAAIRSLTISPKNPEVKRGEQLQFTYTMEGDEDAVKEAEQQGVIWEVKYADGSETSYSNINRTTGLLSVGVAESMGVRKLKVICKANIDDTIVDYTYVTVVVAKGQYNVELIARTLTTYQFDNDTKTGYRAIIECLPSWANYKGGYPKIKWEVVKSSTGSTNGFSLSAPDDGDIYKQVLDCSYNLNTTVTVRAEVYLDENVVVYPSIDIEIPNMKSAMEANAPYIDSSQYVLYRNGIVRCTLKRYDGDMSKVTWRIANDIEEELAPPKAEEDDELEHRPWEGEAQAKRLVGFSKWFANGNAVTPEIANKYFAGWDGENHTQRLYPSAEGESVCVWAKHTIPWYKEYRLTLEAVDENGNVIADTCVLIPRATLLFPGEKRYIEINQKDQYNGIPYQELSVTVYGYAQGYQGGGLTTEGAKLNLYGEISGNTDKETQILNDGFYLGTDDGKLPIKISANEKGSALYMTFYDKDHPGDDTYAMKRALVVFWNSWSKQNGQNDTTK